MQNTHLGIPGETRQLGEQVLVEELPRRVRVLFTVCPAHPLGQSGERGRAVDLMNRARSVYLDGATAKAPVRAWWLTEAEITWHEAMIHSDTGDGKTTVPLLTEALDARPPDYRRGILSHPAHLAHSLARQRAWTDTAHVLEHHVPPGTAHIASGRTTTLLTRVFDVIRCADTPTSVQSLAEHACRPWNRLRAPDACLAPEPAAALGTERDDRTRRIPED